MMRAGLEALNEGRGLNPGDTHPCILPVWARSLAQRRPGPEPRRHALNAYDHASADDSLNEGRGLNPGDTARNGPFLEPVHVRSTKAGA